MLDNFGFDSGPTSVTVNNPQVGLYAQTANRIPITNTITENSLIDGGVGSLSIPANTFTIGSSFIASLSGVISSKNNDKLRIKVKTGAIILGDTGLITMPQTTNKKWDLEVHFTIRAIGGIGIAAILTSGTFTYSKDASNAFEGGDFSTLNNTTFNTTIANTLDITAQWNAANVQNSIYTQYFNLYRVF